MLAQLRGHLLVLLVARAGSARWVYATEGAGSHDPEPGAIEAWVWQEGGRQEPPDIAFRTLCPQAVQQPGTRTPTATPPPSTASEPVPLPDLTTTPADLKPTEPLSAAPTSSSASSSAGATTPAPSSSSASAAAAPSVTNAADDTGGDDGGGPPLVGLALGTVLVAVLGGAALARSRRTGGSP